MIRKVLLLLVCWLLVLTVSAWSCGGTEIGEQEEEEEEESAGEQEEEEPVGEQEEEEEPGSEQEEEEEEEGPVGEQEEEEYGEEEEEEYGEEEEEEGPLPYSIIYDGEWESNEESGGLISYPVLRFEIESGRIITFTTWVFPITDELFMWIYDEQLDIQDDKFEYSMTSGEGEFVLEGEFTSENACAGTMKFTAGFLLVDITLTAEVNISWTAERK